MALKTFIISFVAGVLAVALLWLLMVYAQLGRDHPHNIWVESSYEHKLVQLEEVPSPRVIVIAGSSALFGIDSALLSAELGLPVFNLGVNAGLQAPLIAHYARQAIRPGDHVILALEYNLYHFRQDLNQVFIDYLLSNPDLVPQLPLDIWAQVLWKTSMQRVLQGYRGVPEGFTVAHGLYGPHNQSHLGDQINSAASQRAPWMIEGVAQHAGEHYGARFGLDLDLSIWLSLVADVVSGGGCAVAIPPPMLYHPRYADEAVEAEYFTRLPQLLIESGMPYRGDPYRFMYSAEFFFDTNFHLTQEHRSYHTRQVAELVADAFAECCDGCADR